MYTQPMLDVELLRKNPEKVKKGIEAKQADDKLVDDFLRVDGKWREMVYQLDELRAEQKKLGEERKIEEAKAVKTEIIKLEEELNGLGAERDLILIKIPNIPDDDVPVGKDESENKVIRSWGEQTKFSFTPKDHLELGEALGIIDVETAGRVSGNRFNYLKGEAVLLQFAVIQHVMHTLTDQKVMAGLAKKIGKNYPAKTFTPVLPPVMIRPKVFRRMARLNPGEEDERYHLEKDDLYLVGSAEHTMGPMHMDDSIPEEKLPLRYVGYSTSFRREAGSHGRDVRGILRAHQFDKIEIESFTLAEDSRKEQDFIVSIQEHLLQSLNLPYQVMAVCTGDMGAPDARQIDINTWMPGQNLYRETHTSDMMTDYQARRLGTRVKRANGKTELVHMNDATVFAMGRILIAIIENYQRLDGSIGIPEVLQKYTGFSEIKKS